LLLLRYQGLLAQALVLEFPANPHQPWDYILVRTWSGEKLEPSWEGPYLVPLTTETAVHTIEKEWTHYTRAKWTPQGDHSVVSSKPSNAKVILKSL
jgi:hypothetical protein